MTNIEMEIEKKVSEMLRIHKNTYWWGISEKLANKLGDRLDVLEKQIEELRKAKSNTDEA
tara:strand:- start:373 stop:552 length:180 start_codon:yes stop_codon:yes gene_type:complete